MRFGRFLLVSIFLLTLVVVKAQDEDDQWASWDNNYIAVNMMEILKLERFYADSVEANPTNSQYYARLDKYRFEVVYLNEFRTIDKESERSILDVFRLFSDPEQLKDLLEEETLVLLGNERVWMAIQPQLISDLKKDHKAGDTILVYCLFLNEHTSDKKLFNNFLISEFQ